MPTATLTVTNSTIANNSAGDQGGGIWNYGGTLTATNSTIAYNSYNSAGYGGGGIGNGFNGAEVGTAMLENTIVVLNTYGTGSGAPASDISVADGGTVSSASAYNLIGTGGSGGLVNGTNGNQVGVADPGLDPNGLQNNGGPTQTIALVTGSPAIDAGSNALAVDPTTGQPLTTDQRGALRGPAGLNAGRTVDIGAVRGELLVPRHQHGRHYRRRHPACRGRLGECQHQRQSGQRRLARPQHGHLRHGRHLRHAADDHTDARDPGAEQHGHARVDRRHRRGEPDRGPQQRLGDALFRHFHGGCQGPSPIRRSHDHGRLCKFS